MEQLSLFDDINVSVDVSDPILKQRLETLILPKSRRAFGRTSRSGIHEIGIEAVGRKSRKGNVPLVAIPGWLHNNSAFIKLITALARDRIDIAALSPFGYPGSRPMRKPIESLTVEDYLEPYQDYLNDRDEEVVLMGHSLGGLFSQLLAARCRDRVQGLILINSVKPSNLAKRLHSVVDSEGPVFKPMDVTGDDQMKWIIEKLFNGRVPKDITWIANTLAPGSNNVLDDYSGKHGFVDPRSITQPILEIVGDQDQETIAGVFNPEVLNQKEMIFEVESFVKGRRIMISEFFAKNGNCPNFEQVVIEGGSHNSPILSEDHVELTAQAIRENYWSMFGRPRS